MQPLAAPSVEASWRYEGWGVVVACFCMAVFGWGLGFYGHSVYLAELQRVHGWPATWIASATTGFYLLGALFVVFISEAMRVLGPRVCLLVGVACMATATMALGRITAPWQLYAVYVVMALGWAGTSLGAITTTLGLWFDRRRGMAISLALNGASCGGIVGVPLLVLAIGALGFAGAVLAAGIAMIALLVPLIVICIGRPPVALRTAAPGGIEPAMAPRRIRAEALRSVAFLSVTIAFFTGAVRAGRGHRASRVLPRSADRARPFGGCHRHHDRDGGGRAACAVDDHRPPQPAARLGAVVCQPGGRAGGADQCP
jgi:MFS family permease